MTIVKAKGMIISNTTITNTTEIKKNNLNNKSGNKLINMSDLNMIIENSLRFY